MEEQHPDFLTFKQRTFCNEYLVDMNATRAALRAGYSAATALNGALMRIPKIQLYLQRHATAATDRAQITQDMVLKELAKIAFGNMGNYFTDDGRMKPMDALNADEKAALLNVIISKDGSTQVKMNNKMQALDKIARHLNFYKPTEKPAETFYVYLDERDMTADDWFEDEQEEKGEEPEGGSRKPEAMVDEDEILRDGAGIPYDMPVMMDKPRTYDIPKPPAVSEVTEKPVYASALKGKYVSRHILLERKKQAKLWRTY
jgi:phage terminase small subunit